MNGNAGRQRPIVRQIGWVIVFAVAGLLVLHGVIWAFMGPEIALTNIAERVEVSADAFRQGSPSAFRIIALTQRNYGLLEVGFGALVLAVGWRGYRHGLKWAGAAMTVVPVTIGAMAANFILVGGIQTGASYLLVALIGLAGVLLAGRSRP